MELLGHTVDGRTVKFEANVTGVPDAYTSFWRQGVGGPAKLATAVSGAATLNKENGLITSEALTTAAGAEYTLTLANAGAKADDFIFVTLQNGTNTAGAPGVRTATPTAGQIVIIIHNFHATAALNGTIKIGYFTMRGS